MLSDLSVPFLLFVVGLHVVFRFLILQTDLGRDALGWPHSLRHRLCCRFGSVRSQIIQQHKKGSNSLVLPLLQSLFVLLHKSQNRDCLLLTISELL